MGVESSYLKHLNREQRSAVLHDTGPAMVIAGAGTGKTGVITSRIAYLIEQKKALPEQILALTFTDKAAHEMEARVDQLLPYGYVETEIMTFHALGNMILQDHGFELGLPRTLRLISTLQQHILLRDVLENMEGLQYFRPHNNPGLFRDTILSYISRLKDSGLTPVGFRQSIHALPATTKQIITEEELAKYNEVARIYDEYQEKLHARGYIDYGDQLVLVLQLLREKRHILKDYQQRYRYILVDEFQDTNTVQADLLQLLAGEHKNIMVVGDDDQSIYRFRGAELQNMLDFQEHYPGTKVYLLTENYRSTQHIVDAAYNLIQHNNPNRLEVKVGVSKRLHAKRRGKRVDVRQLPTIHDELAYIAEDIERRMQKGIAADEIAVLCRNNTQAAELIAYLQHRGLPVGTPMSKNLLHEPVVRQCIDFVRVLHDEEDSAALYRYLTSPKGAVRTVEVMGLSAIAQRRRVSLRSVVQDSDVVTAKNALIGLDAYREYAHDHSIGEVLYRFISDGGYLDRLVVSAQKEEAAALAVQSLAAFFSLVKDFEAIETHRDSYGFWQYLQDMYSSSILDEADLLEAKDGIQVLTAHRAKGLEFGIVYIFDVTESTFPARRQGEPLKLPLDLIETPNRAVLEHQAEERRLMYVAMTRAGKHLVMTYSLDHGGKRAQKPSRFLLEAFSQDVAVKSEAESAMPAILTRFGPRMHSGGDVPSFTEVDGWLELTPNQVADYLADPSQFFVRHILRFPSPPTHQMIYGVATHAGLEYFYREKIAGRQPKLQVMLDEFHSAWRSEGFVSLRHERERLAQGEASLRRYYTANIAEEVEVLAVESDFRCEIDNIKVRLRGRYDLVLADKETHSVEIRDFKTSQIANERYAQDKVRDSIQMAIYAYAWDENNEVKTSSISLYFTESDLLARRSKIEHSRTLRKIAEVAEGIRAGRYPRKGNMTDLETQDLYA